MNAFENGIKIPSHGILTAFSSCSAVIVRGICFLIVCSRSVFPYDDRRMQVPGGKAAGKAIQILCQDGLFDFFILIFGLAEQALQFVHFVILSLIQMFIIHFLFSPLHSHSQIGGFLIEFRNDVFRFLPFIQDIADLFLAVGQFLIILPNDLCHILL